MTFIHSVRGSFGINPSFKKSIFIKISGKGIGWSSTAPISSYASSNKVIEDKIIENSQIYGSLVDIGNTTPQALNELQQSFLKSVGWYKRGRWKEDYTSSFLDYWIALEHILAEGDKNKLDILLRRLPSFHISWRNLSGTWGLKQTRKQIITFINMDNDFKTKINDDSELIGWDKYDYVLLNPDNLRKLINYTNNQDVKKYIKRFIDKKLTSAHISAYTKLTKNMREEFKFKIFLLNSLRNNIVHGAMDYHPNIDLYFNVLKSIVEDCLLKIFNEAVSTSSTCNTLDDLILDLEKPW